MDILVLQEKIECLLTSVRKLLSIEFNASVYVDNFSQLNESIHKQINELYPLRGKTPEQDASLCIALLMGYSVSMYANPDDETKKYSVLLRSQKLLRNLSPSPLKKQLSNICEEFKESCSINYKF